MDLTEVRARLARLRNELDEQEAKVTSECLLHKQFQKVGAQTGARMNVPNPSKRVRIMRNEDVQAFCCLLVIDDVLASSRVGKYPACGMCGFSTT